MFVWQADRLASRINIFCGSLPMGFVCPCYFSDPLADERVRDDELRFSVVASLRHVQRVEKLLHVMAIDFMNIEAVCLHSFAGVLALRLFGRGIERDGI